VSKDVYSRRVKAVMSKDVVTVHHMDSVHEALVLMSENRVSALPAVDGHGRCTGIISTTDLVDLTRELDEDLEELERADVVMGQWLFEKLKDDIGHQSVNEAMSRDVATIGPEALLVEAAHEMRRHRVHHLPVVDENKKLLGIVSTMDLLDALVEGAPAETGKPPKSK